MRMKLNYEVFLLTISFLQTIFAQSHEHHERKLIKHLLGDYEPLERPVAKDDDVVDLKYDLKLIKISNLCLKKQTLSSIVWIKMRWTDINLKWNPSDYGNIKTTLIPPNKIWVPDVVPYSAENMDEVDPRKLSTNVVVDSSGNCIWIPPMNLKSTCEINDSSANEQSCKIKLGSWTYNGVQLNVTLLDATPDLSDYVPSRKWDLINATSERQEIKYDCCPEKYISLIYTFNLKKQGILGRMLGWD